MEWNSLEKPSGFLKLLEIVFSILFVSLSLGMNGYFVVTKPFLIFFGGVIMLALVVTPLLLVVHVYGRARDLQRTPLEVLFNVVMAIFLTVAGAVVIFFNTGRTNVSVEKIGLVGTAIFINAVFYVLDAAFAAKIMRSEA